MGFFSILAASNKKTKVMRKASLILSRMKSGDDEMVYKELHECISNYPLLKPIVEEYHFTCDELVRFSSIFRALGFGWEGTDYVPVSVFCFRKSLIYILEN
jgi:hypothetical protein